MMKKNAYTLTLVWRIIQQLDMIMIPWIILTRDNDASVKENLIKP